MPTNNKERRLIYKERKNQGFCPRCGQKKRKSDKNSYCEDCREYFRDYNYENADIINQARQDLYHQRKKNNQCPRCGKKIDSRYENIICRNCLAKANK